MRPLILAVLSSLCGACSAAGIEASGDLEVVSRYVSRGAVILDEAAAQPAFTAALPLGDGTLTALLWANLALESESVDAGEATELDGYLDWTMPLGGWTAIGGIAHYTYPADGSPASTELYAAVSWDELEVLTPTLSLYWDVDQAEDPYAALAAERTFDLSEELALTTTASLGWMRAGQGAYYFGVERDGFSDLTLEALLSWSAGESIELWLRAGVARVLADAYRDGVDEADPIWLGLGASCSF